jgi:hypothetical protein
MQLAAGAVNPLQAVANRRIETFGCPGPLRVFQMSNLDTLQRAVADAATAYADARRYMKSCRNCFHSTHRGCWHER